PRGSGHELCEREILRRIRRRTLAALRKEIEPVAPSIFGRFETAWHGVMEKRSGMSAVLETLEMLQGYPIAASILESEILSSRIAGYDETQLDRLAAAGELVWIGTEPLGEKDGRVALYFTDHLPLLHEPRPAEDLTPRETAVVELLRRRGASFFRAIHEACGGGFENDTVDAVWNLVWKGLVTNDTLEPLRAFTRPPRRRRRADFRSRLDVPPAVVGRWSLVEQLIGRDVSRTERMTAVAQQLLARYGVVTRESGAAESIPGGFSAVYDLLKQMEERGRVRRGYFIAGVAATQFALPPALDRLRAAKSQPDQPESVILAATDPANPYGSLLPWPESGRQLSRSVGARVILVDGALALYVSRGEGQMLAFLPEDEPDRGRTAAAVARELARWVEESGRRTLLIPQIDEKPAGDHPLAAALIEEGFVATAMGLQFRRGFASGVRHA
ncbi:MAG: DEAD/DEAH box helicase, partial [Thermoanaerobaculia bacterium]